MDTLVITKLPLINLASIDHFCLNQVFHVIIAK